MSMKTEPLYREVDLTNTDLVGLNDVYREIADEIGFENALVIFKLFHGTQVTFPNRLFTKEHTYRSIIDEYNGKNITHLARKYNYSERNIWRILQRRKVSED